MSRARESDSGSLIAPIVEEGRNCWVRRPASRVACLIDGQRYFTAFAAAAARARHSIYLAGWDVHSRVRLLRDEPRPPELEGLPSELGELLCALLERRPGLRAWLLDWDFSTLFALERESFPLSRLGDHVHPRLEFRLDDNHPLGGSQHQKLVVIDDQVAFSGGLDLTAARWDTRAHLPRDPRRQNPQGSAYGPFHDVQMAVEGEAAATLGELFRARWRRATGQGLKPPPAGRATPWPPHLTPDFERVSVAIARTEPAWGGQPEVREVERLHLDAIAAAREVIYVESQYATSTILAEALEERLREPGGPEVVLVLPLHCSGWLEQATMGLARQRFLARLRAAGAERLFVYYPVVQDDGGPPISVNLHSKLVIVDDVLLRVGSANLSNRSMGLDSECDLALELEAPADRARVTALRDDLVAEHLGVPVEEVSAALARHGSLGAAIESLRREQGRTLVPLREELEDWVQAMLPEEPLFDPERPVALEAVLAERQREDEPPEREWLGLRIAGSVLLVLGLLALWTFTPISEWTTDPERTARWLGASRGSPAGLLAALTVFVLGSLVMIPLVVLIPAALLVLGPALGFVCAALGSLTSAAAGYGVGRALAGDTLTRLGGRRLHRLSEGLRRRGFLAVAAVRMLPLAPFMVVNVVAGASSVRFRDFMLGSLVVLLPGIGLMALGMGPVLSAIEEPSAVSVGLAVVVVLGLCLGGWWIRSRLRHAAERANGSEPRPSR